MCGERRRVAALVNMWRATSPFTPSEVEGPLRSGGTGGPLLRGCGGPRLRSGGTGGPSCEGAAPLGSAREERGATPARVRRPSTPLGRNGGHSCEGAASLDSAREERGATPARV